MRAVEGVGERARVVDLVQIVVVETGGDRVDNRPPFRGESAGQRSSLTPAASRSQVVGVTPLSRRSNFWILPVGVLGSASTASM